ncbi:calmodulin-beta [Octopus bimaculoides]|uniref:EF-hand domain-containing protein n=1 Tax=Octopus bimaculoides TaxID=37653 RepID=A0A0L8HQL4_OCTBM|nr:calmodulin-beta [Octopus bimaculoides]|eukprot:XP_014770346.1 PREDICTED: calmodulin-beta-like [Octopus bimaculoides]
MYCKELMTSGPNAKMLTKSQVRHPEKELKELREAFRFLDINGDGTVSVHELRTIMHSLGHFPSTEELRQVLRDHNFTGDGFLTFDEFVGTMASYVGFSTSEHEKELRETFKYFDRSGRGFISSDDLRTVLECLGEDITEEELEEMIAEVDINGDGRIDFEEFIACLKEHDDRRWSVSVDLSPDNRTLK